MTFGEWIRDTTVDLPQIELVRRAATSLGNAWPVASERKSDFRTALADQQNAVAALVALDEVWSVYLEVSGAKPTWFRSLATAKNAGLLALAGIAVVIVLVIYHASQDVRLASLSDINNARGLLTLLFGITTVGTALIIVLAVFLGEDAEDGLAKRFQRGKDILTVLIGVFGAILGFYFGSDKGPPSAKPPVAEHVEDGKPPRPGGAAQPDDKATGKPEKKPPGTPELPNAPPPPAAGAKQP